MTENQLVHQDLVPDMSGASINGIHRCNVCGELTSKWEEPLLGVVIKRRNYDLSITYDGVLIASERFRALYTAQNLSGLEFRKLPDDSHFFAVRASRVVEFDVERRKTRFITPCETCRSYESVVGATPVFLKPGSEVGPREFVRTDVEFGSNDEKHPLLLCGDQAQNAIVDAKLNGLDLSRIERQILS